MSESQEWHVRDVEAPDRWFQMQVEYDGKGASRDDWAVVAAEAFVAAVADDYGYDDGDMIRTELTAPDGREYRLLMVVRRVVQADAVGPWEPAT